MTLTGTFNSASNKSHDVFKTRTTARTVDIRIGGNTSGYPKLAMEMMVASYNIARDTAGTLTWTATLNLSNGTVPAWSTV